MARSGVVTCPNCKTRIRIVTLHRIKVLGTSGTRRERERAEMEEETAREAFDWSDELP